MFLFDLDFTKAIDAARRVSTFYLVGGGVWTESVIPEGYVTSQGEDLSCHDPTAQVRDLRTMNDLVNWAVRQERVLGRPVEDPSRTPSAVIHHKRHNYFAVLGLRLLRGRDFTELDQESAPGVAILNETLVRNYFPDEGPLGKAIKLLVDDREKWCSIVGAIADVKNVSCMREAARGAVCSILWRSVLLFYIASRFLTETRANW